MFVHCGVEKDVRENSKDAQQKIKGAISFALFGSEVGHVVDMLLAACVMAVVVDFQANKVKSSCPCNRGDENSEDPTSSKPCFGLLLHLGSALIFVNL